MLSISIVITTRVLSYFILDSNDGLAYIFNLTSYVCMYVQYAKYPEETRKLILCQFDVIVIDY